MDDLAISMAENSTGDLTFYFRDLFFGLFLHHLLLELDLGHLGHLLSLCQKHPFEQQEADHETEQMHTRVAGQ